MITEQLLDATPILGVFVAFALVALFTYEVGFRIGRWWQRRTPDEKEGPTGMLVASLLGLLAFLLAVTMGMASDRFDTRRRLVLDETNSIGTTYLRAGFLDEPDRTDVRKLLREYVPLRVTVNDTAQFQANQARSVAILDEIWARTESAMRVAPQSEAVSQFVTSLSETIDLQTTRVASIVYARVPETILLLLVAGEVLAMGVVGYVAGLTGKRGVVTAVVLVVVLGAVLTVVVDLDRPRDGFLQVSQQPLIDLSIRLGAP